MKKGFTLVELLIYLALVSGMLVSFIYYTIGVTSSAEDLSGASNAVGAARLMLNLISAKTRGAIGVLEPLALQTSNKLILQLTATTTLAFEVVNGVLVATDQASNSLPLNSQDIPVSDMSFERLDSGGSANISINLTTNGINWHTSVTQKITP